MAEVARGRRLSDVDLASRKAREASTRRYQAARWLRQTVGVVVGKDLPEEPSEQDFRSCLRSGIVLCTALNKVHPGAVPKIIEPPSNAGIAFGRYLLTAYQYFENVRNFLDAADHLGIPTFEASDLDQGGKCSRVVNCILALKLYNEWKQSGETGLWRYSKSSPSEKQLVRRSLDSFTDHVSDNLSAGEGLSSGKRPCADPAQENGTVVVENVLNNVVVDCHPRVADNKEQAGSNERWVEQNFGKDESKGGYVKHQNLFEKQQITIQDLKNKLHSTKEDFQTMQMEYQNQVECLCKHINDLAQAASGYHKVLEENRKLYNQVQDLKGNIRVYCRIRPFLPGQLNHSSIVEDLDERLITIRHPSKTGKPKKAFSFNRVFGPSGSQEEVFADMKPLIRSVLDGYNVCIFAYGQTGSGKTYTMSGPKELLTAESLGVNYRALDDLFSISEDRKDTISYDISVQMIEIYNEQIRDLLSTDGHNKKIEICNNSSTGINIPNANLIPVTSKADVIRLMNFGHQHRAVGSTLMNDRSSRSHSCLTVHVQGKDLTSGSVLHGSMHLVDLAGSERVDKTDATGDRLKEAQHINRSLSALGDVITSLAQKQLHVPYRNTKLTHLLQHSLGGQAKTLMFVHISPEPDSFGETISTLKFAERVSTVELGAPRVNKEGSNFKELKHQIAALKVALAHKEGDAADSDQAEEISVSSSVSRRLSLDSQDALANTSLPVVLFNTPNMRKGNDKRIHGASKTCLEPALNKVLMQQEIAIINDCDELEVSTSDSSETDLRRPSSMTNLAEQIKAKRTSPQPGRSSPVPQPTRRLSNGSPASASSKNRRQTASAAVGARRGKVDLPRQ